MLVNVMYFSPLIFVKGPLICFFGVFQIIFTETKQTDMPHIFKLLMMQKAKLLSQLESSVLFHFKNK